VNRWNYDEIMFTGGEPLLFPAKLAAIEDFITLNNLMNEGTAGLFDGKSMRLNLFPDIKKALPDNINLSKWQIKEMEWIKDCPVPKGEDFRRVSELWTM